MPQDGVASANAQARGGVSPLARERAGLRARAVRLSRWCGRGAILLGLAVLIGWRLDVEMLKAVAPGLATMKAPTALCFVLLGIALQRLARPEASSGRFRGRADGPALVAAGLVVVVSGLFVVQWISGRSLGIDGLPFAETGGSTGEFPGRMAFGTALLLLGEALALLLVDRRRGLGTTAAQTLASLCGIGAFVILTGYLYGVRDLYAIPALATVALHSAVGIAVVAAGILTLRPGRGLARVLTDESAGGGIARRLLPVAVLLPMLAGWLVVLRGQGEAGTSLFDWALAQAASSVLLISIVLWTALWLHRIDRRRRRAERALRASEARFHVMAEAAPVMIWMSGPDGLCTYVNQGWKDFTGRGVELERGEAWPSAVHEADQARCVELWAAAFAARAPIDLEFRMRRKDGEWRWIADRGVPLRGEAGEFLGYIGTCFDMTERKRAEQAREQTLAVARRALDRAEEGSRLKDEFLALVSHELRTPLNSILGWAQILRDDAGGMSPAEQGRALEVIERNARAQTRLVEDLLDMSRILTGKVRLQPEVIPDLGQVLSGVVDGMRPAANARAILLEVALPASPCAVRADPDRIRQIAWNLISNAVKFTPKGGRVRISLEGAGSDAVLRVADTGKGIRPKFLPQVFDRFSQEESGSTRQFGGLGLGLSVVRHLVELNGGTIGAESPGEGLGSTFTVHLPLHQAAVEAAPRGVASSASADSGRKLPSGPVPDAGSAPAPCLDPGRDRWSPPEDTLGVPVAASMPASSRPLSGKRVLLVDDDPDVLDTIRVILERAGANVRAVSSAAEALGSLSDWQPAVLVSDVGMPLRDGYWLVQQVRALPRAQGGGIPAIALTAYARNEDRAQALHQGFDLHLGKPIDASQLVAAVASVRRLDS